MARGYRDEDYDADHHSIDDVRAIAETEKAIKVIGTDAEDPEKAEWIPKSQVHENSEVYADEHVGKLVVTGWFARKQGWI